jgi:hypothetical protein
VTVAVTSLWLAFGLLRRYMRATPLPTDLTARQRVLLVRHFFAFGVSVCLFRYWIVVCRADTLWVGMQGLPPVADTPDKTTPRRPPAARGGSSFFSLPATLQ